MRTIATLATFVLLAGGGGSAPPETLQQLIKKKFDPASKVYFRAVR